MNTYLIVHTETLRGYYYIDAESPEDACDRWYDEVCANKVDFSDLDLINTEDEAELVLDDLS